MSSQIKRATTLIMLLALFCFWVEGAAALNETVHSFHVRLFSPGSRTTTRASGTERMEFHFESRLEVVIPYDGGTIASEVSPWAEFIAPRLVIDGADVPLPLEGKRFDVVFDADGSVVWAEPVPELAAYGIYLLDLLSTLYPPPRPSAASQWTVEHQQRLLAPGGIWEGSVSRRYQALSPTEIQMIVNHQVTRLAFAQRPGVTWVGSASLRLDPTSQTVVHVSYSLRGSLTAPDGGESVEYRLIVLIERLGEDVRAREPAPQVITIRYDDPAQRFRLELPLGWDPVARQFAGTSTVLKGPDSTLLIVDILAADHQQGAEAVLAELLARYSESLPQFQLLTPSAPTVLAGERAWLAEYEFAHEEALLIEGSVVAPFADQVFLLSLVGPAEWYRESGRETLERIAERLQFIDPHGHVDAELLREAAWVRYQSGRWRVELEVPEYWVPVSVGGPQAGIRFAEIGGAGHLRIHFEPVYTSPEDVDPLLILQRWIEQLQQSDPAFQLVEAPSSTYLGGATAATVTIGTTDGAGVSWHRQLTISVWGEELVALIIDYRGDGFAERQDVFQRIRASLRPWDEPTASTSAESELPPPTDATHLLVIGRVVHAAVSDLNFSPLPAAHVEVTLQVGSVIVKVATDDQGYFYLANVPPDQAIALKSVQGSLFGLEDETVVTFDDLNAQVRGRVGLLDELLLVLTPDGEMRALTQSGIDMSARRSRLHAHVVERFPDSPWASVLQANLPLWFGEPSAGNS